ncbi:MAG: alpha/beta fold hydrolase [Rhizomicrobium sp.]|jgi:pimeloyl-ACP methyl ester carboxylesterase
MGTSTHYAAVLPGRDSPLGLASWARELASVVSVSVNPPPYPDRDLPRGDGATVLLLPGFLGGDWTMGRLRHFLESLGYRAEHAGIVFNPGPTAATLARIDSTLLRLGAERGAIHLVGQSIGGAFALALAHRHPQHVRSVVTLCTPLRFPVTTPLAPFVRACAPLHTREWSEQVQQIAKPPAVAVTAIYSRDDGIVDWRQCLQDEALRCRNVHVSGAHSTMGSNPDAQIAVALALETATASS